MVMALQLNIQNEGVCRLASRLAEQAGKSLTTVVTPVSRKFLERWPVAGGASPRKVELLQTLRLFRGTSYEESPLVGDVFTQTDVEPALKD
jgi:hypothetical protein